MTTSEETKRRIITLTNTAPVSIVEDEWPVIASADGDSYSARDPGRHRQARQRGELDIYKLRVRQHASGRVIVYGVLDASHAWTGSTSCRGGELLAADADLAAAIRRVGEYCSLPDEVIRACIADLPPVEL